MNTQSGPQRTILPVREAPVTGATVIARGMDWRGDLVAAEDVVVCGTLLGIIESTCRVLVLRSGRVQGRISAAEVVVAGIVEGDVAAAHRIRVESTGRVQGELEARSVSMAEGAQVGGRIRTLEQDRRGPAPAGRS